MQASQMYSSLFIPTSDQTTEANLPPHHCISFYEMVHSVHVSLDQTQSKAFTDFSISHTTAIILSFLKYDFFKFSI